MGDVLYVLAVTAFLAVMVGCVLLWDRIGDTGCPTSPVGAEPAGSRAAGPAGSRAAGPATTRPA